MLNRKINGYVTLYFLSELLINRFNFIKLTTRTYFRLRILVELMCSQPQLFYNLVEIFCRFHCKNKLDLLAPSMGLCPLN